MLSLTRRKRFGPSNRNKILKNNKESRMQWPGDGYMRGFKDDEDLEAGFARPREPIRVTMVQDEEVHVGGREVEDDPEKELPPPPPAYGLWRSSVVCLLPFLFLFPFPSPFSRSPFSRSPFTFPLITYLTSTNHPYYREPTPTSSTGNPSPPHLATHRLRSTNIPALWF